MYINAIKDNTFFINGETLELAKAEKKRQEKACESTNPQIKEIAETALLVKILFSAPKFSA